MDSYLLIIFQASRLKTFQDPSISDAHIVLDLVDAIKPGSINYELVKTDGSPEVGLTKKIKIILIFIILEQIGKCEIRHHNGTQNRGQNLCAPRRYCPGERWPLLWLKSLEIFFKPLVMKKN